MRSCKNLDRKSYLFYGTINKNYEMICYINSLAIDEVETCCYFDKYFFFLLFNFPLLESPSNSFFFLYIS